MASISNVENVRRGWTLVRPNVSRRYTIQGQAGTYLVPTIEAVDKRLRTLRGMLNTHHAPGRIWADIDAILDWRLELMAERSK